MVSKINVLSCIMVMKTQSKHPPDGACVCQNPLCCEGLWDVATCGACVTTDRHVIIEAYRTYIRYIFIVNVADRSHYQ